MFRLTFCLRREPSHTPASSLSHGGHARIARSAANALATALVHRRPFAGQRCGNLRESCSPAPPGRAGPVPQLRASLGGCALFFAPMSLSRIFLWCKPAPRGAKQFAPALFVVLPPRFGVGGCLAGVSQRQVAAPHLAGSPPLYVCAGAAAFLAARVGAVNRAPLAAFFARGDATSTLLRRLSRKGGSPHPFGL